ncbi:MAG: hypothetical protein ABIG09_01380 [bacterium]
MIVPMKKVSIIVQIKDSFSVVKFLSKMGVLHVTHQNLPKGKEITELKIKISLANQVMGILGIFKTQRVKKEIVNWEDLAKQVVDSKKRLEELEESAITFLERIREWEKWGDFNLDQIQDLAKKGIFIRLYQLPLKMVQRSKTRGQRLQDLPEEVVLKVVHVSGGIAYCVAISKEKIKIPFKEIQLPEMSLGKMKARLKEDMEMTEIVKKELMEYGGYKDSLFEIMESLEKQLEFFEAVKGMGEEGQFLYLVGYAPYYSVNKLTEASKKEGWGVVIDDPSKEDLVPTLIQNPRWISIINPVLRFIGAFPGYGELDISLCFLTFLSIFFGILIGDLGYGLIYFILTIFLQRKFNHQVADKSIFYLFYLLSSCAMIWGLLTATFFGTTKIISPLVPALTESKNVQLFCFYLGVVHLTIGHLWRATLKLPGLKALADIGWILILWSGLFLAKVLILGYSFPVFGEWFAIIGGLLIILFTNPEKNILKGISNGLGAFLLNVVNSFVDIVSYIRLFAVGLASVAVADSFNKMALDVGFSSLTAGLIASLLIFVGHGLNIVVGPIAVLVHGVRLNMLEFGNHADIKWGGFVYKPFKE